VTGVVDPQLERVETRLPATSASPRAARRFVGTALRRCEIDVATVEAAQLLVSELVTNAIVHTSSEVRLSVSIQGDAIRVEVTDRGDGVAQLRMVDSDSTGGRGLGIVDGIARAWGSDPRREGKAVWFELAQ
jgi:anti-sigma regulatory factor (Ser/Thr protein kinase)